MSAAGRPRRAIAYVAVVATVIVLASLLSSPPAAAHHWRDGPSVSGPLVPWLWPVCGTRDVEQHPGYKVVAEVHACLWQFYLPPAAETDLTGDYWAYWIVAQLDPRPGYCIKMMRIWGFPGDDGRMTEHEGPSTGPAGGRTQVRLLVDAEGHAPVPGTLSMAARLPEGTIREREESVQWKGLTRKTLEIPIGFEGWADLDRYDGDDIGATTREGIARCDRPGRRISLVP